MRYQTNEEITALHTVAFITKGQVYKVLDRDTLNHEVAILDDHGYIDWISVKHFKRKADSSITTPLGQRLDDKIEKLGYSCSRFCAEYNIEPTKLHRIRTGRQRMPYDLAIRLESILKVNAIEWYILYAIDKLEKHRKNE